MNRLWRIAAPLLLGVAFLALWEAAVRIEAVPPYILPGPVLIAESLWTDGPSLLGSLLVTLRVTLAALAAAALVGTIGGNVVGERLGIDLLRIGDFEFAAASAGAEAAMLATLLLAAIAPAPTPPADQP